jgi:inhibitor of cysteine peptidase
MKTKMVVIAAMATVLLAAGACSPAVGASSAKEANVEVTIDEFTNTQHIAKAIEIAEGGVVTVSLGSNPSTGFSWNETAQIEAPAVLEQTDSKVLPSEKEGLVGASGSQVWTFKALQKGTTTVSLEYGRPWEGGEKGVWTFELTVTVK